DPFDVQLYAENLISQNVLKYQKKDEFHADKIYDVFQLKYKNLTELCNKLDQNDQEFTKNYQSKQKDCMVQFEAVNKTLSSTSENLNLFITDIHSIGKKISRFGKGIAIHDLAITRANDLISLFEYFNSFLKSSNDNINIPSDISDDYIKSKLSPKNAEYLDHLYLIYTEIINMELQMVKINSSVDASIFEYYRKLIFAPYISKYFDIEINRLEANFLSLINNLHKNTSGFLQELGVEMVQLSKKSQQRCELLSPLNNLPYNTCRIYETMVNNLMLKASMNEIDTFYKAAVTSSIYHEKVTHALKAAMTSFESKIDMCLDKYINICVNHIKATISSKLNNKVLLYSGNDTIQSDDIIQACAEIKKFNSSIKTRLDNNNYEKIGLEFSVRLNKFLVQFYREFNYSVEGAMVALWDIKEFKSAFATYNMKEIDEIFDTMYALLNILVVSPDDIKNISMKSDLVKIDTQLIQAYAEKRKDYKQSKISRLDKS
ncbi:hypothetical protein HZS_6440, partial [Henneguya salminicola]